MNDKDKRQLDEALKLFLLSDNELNIKAQTEALKILKDEKYNSYDKEFRRNFFLSFTNTFLKEINDNRENMAYTLQQNKYPNDIILEAGRISEKQLNEMNILENKTEIIAKYLNKIKNT